MFHIYLWRIVICSDFLINCDIKISGNVELFSKLTNLLTLVCLSEIFVLNVPCKFRTYFVICSCITMERIHTMYFIVQYS